MKKDIRLIVTKRTDSRLLDRMKIHYSKPKGFVGRNICYSIIFNGDYYGHIVAGSATRFLPNRNEFFNISLSELNNIINNIFYNISPIEKKYPFRNFTIEVVKKFVKKAAFDWNIKYNDRVLGYETLIEKPRTGELYKRAGWVYIGETKGFTCKRVSGKSTDSYTGRRVWNTKILKPKYILCYKI